jgi:D-amino-acid oxidase
LYRLDSTLILPYLVGKIKEQGGRILRHYVPSLHDQSLHNYSIIVNCTGAANYPFTHDTEAFPLSGHYLLLEKIKGINTIHLSILDDDHYLAIVPRVHDIWLGGTAIGGWDSQMNHLLLQEIYEQCSKIEPRLSKSRILKTGIGFRSGRSKIRVEKELFEDKIVIHNYGQGGSGFSLCWGCAEEVASLVAASTV